MFQLHYKSTAIFLNEQVCQFSKCEMMDRKLRKLRWSNEKKKLTVYMHLSRHFLIQKIHNSLLMVLELQVSKTWAPKKSCNFLNLSRNCLHVFLFWPWTKYTAKLTYNFMRERSNWTYVYNCNQLIHHVLILLIFYIILIQSLKILYKWGTKIIYSNIHQQSY